MTKLAALVFVAATGCATATDGDFHVSGRVADSRVTHVIAINTADGSREIVSKLWDDSFKVTMKPGGQYLLAFADITKPGRDMLVGTLRANDLDALAPQEGGGLDLGKISFANGRAQSTTSFEDIASALGLDESTAQELGLRDDLALRFSNLDVDSNGALEANAPVLRVEGEYTTTLTLADHIEGNFANARVKYLSTTVSASVPNRMNMMMTTGTMMFEQPFFGSALGPNTPKIDAFTQIGQPHVKFGQLDGSRVIGVTARAGFDVPRGAYELDFANGSLTYTNVFPPSAAVLESAQSYSVPFLHVKPNAAGCRFNCAIDALEIDWNTMTATGWKPSTDRAARVEFVLRRNGKDTYLAADLAAGESLNWQALSVTNTGIADYELAYFSTQNICYIAVSYQSELGMQMTNQLKNPACF